ncbi:MAG: right-handed parallel beta-helix repeat-containing protein [Phycisphaerales bacterium]|nr:right-handed parallel beta-helix repeat-containing protein [Phycisphaerales bacterium]MCB9857107.1 right-handed parallel beta-helix repeat-containing protein [Phycisphaerales bacterium]MCB9861766.1 right-handed parallel beta-helix repeat-containing protein [Phycisphaerales bacterium]
MILDATDNSNSDFKLTRGPKPLLRCALFAMAIGMIASAGSLRVEATDYNVNTTADTFDGVCDGNCSLRDALSVAVNGDTVILPAGTFALSRTGPEAENGDLGTVAVFDLDVNDSVTVQGQGPGLTIINATGIGSRVFDINLSAFANVTIRDMTITGGNGTGDASAAAAGGIRCRDRNSTLTVINCDISGNLGNGIGSVATTTITDTTISGNTGNGVRLTNDSATFQFLKDLTIRGSTISGNSVNGVSIFKADDLLIENSTISGNTVDGVLVQLIDAVIDSSTIAFNGDGGVELAAFTDGGFPVAPAVDFRNTIVANNPSGNIQLSGPADPPVSLGHNLLSDNSGAAWFTQASDINNTNPMLAILDLNGSTTTRTHAIGVDSPAFNAGDSLLATDQRGISRPQAGVDDIGAFELVPPDDDMDGFSPPEDCDDNDEFVNPDAPEVFDGVDNNCDGTIDEGFDDDHDGFEDTATGGDDCDDTNEFINPGATEVCDGVDNNCVDGIDEGFDTDNDGYTTCNGDCDDSRMDVNPDAMEICDGIDNNCDGNIDEGCDLDHDGFNPPEDCDDDNEFINPDATEVFDGVDNNCDGTIDEVFDDDGDGYEDVATGGNDCDDGDELINPGATEVFDGVDNNCDGVTDETFDDDGDGFLDDALGGNDCDDADADINPDATETDDGIDNNCNGSTDEGFDGDNDGYTPIFGGDCDDANMSINPGATEIFDGVDNNCDGTIDEGFDDDADGFEDVGTGGNDCDDGNSAINPSATESDDGVDNNCDGSIDEGFDADSDGFTPVAGGDCDDSDSGVNPGATESLDGIDNNCDGTIDEGVDDDRDGFLDADMGGDDCDDTNADVNPDATEVADGIDNDCDGTIDPEPEPNPTPDEDGVDAATEDGAPNGGDGNNDGVKDSEQPNVASLPNSDGNYLTIVAPAGTTLANVVASSNPSPADAPDGVTFPMGFVSFEVRGLQPGASIEVRIIAQLPAGVEIDTYWRYGPESSNTTPHWYEFLYDGTTGAELGGSEITLHLVDGQRGDDDVSANGVIVDPGAPAVAPTIVAPQPTPDCGTGMCASGTAMCVPLLLISMGLVRRRVRRRRRCRR